MENIRKKTEKAKNSKKNKTNVIDNLDHFHTTLRTLGLLPDPGGGVVCVLLNV